jgi:hypothetical protein
MVWRAYNSQLGIAILNLLGYRIQEASIIKFNTATSGLFFCWPLLSGECYFADQRPQVLLARHQQNVCDVHKDISHRDLTSICVEHTWRCSLSFFFSVCQKTKQNAYTFGMFLSPCLFRHERY